MKPVRKISKSNRKVLYLTFDDGPCVDSTETVLQILGKHSVKATFFVVAQTAEKNRALMQKICAQGHAVGNHSWDHGYSRFFRGKTALKLWIEKSEAVLSSLLGETTVGFRPPAGVMTPELLFALRELKMPLILWNTRFYDTAFSWTSKRALKSLETAASGDIILLHDRQSPKKLPIFLQTLEAYIVQAQKYGFEFRALTHSILSENYPQ